MTRSIALLLSFPLSRDRVFAGAARRSDASPARWWRVWREFWRLWRRRVSEREQILRFDQRELRDAGLTSGDVYRELATPFWKTSGSSSPDGHGIHTSFRR
jgi:uncharacterized protein YjiS (DUF1127 family)